MDPQYYTIAAELLPRVLGVIYFIVFAPFIFQIKGLFGHNGIQSIDSYLKFIKSRLGNRRFYLIPTLFWINASDAALLALVWTGTALSIFLTFGFCPPLLLLLLYVLHLSLVAAGQDFLSFGWEMFFLEITFNTIFLSLSSPPNPFIWISLNLLLFRFFFQAGVSKIFSRDVNWRNLKAIWYHYQSQPIPNATAWYVHKLPLWFHKTTTAFMFFIELIVPFFIFGTQEMRLITFILFVGLQISIHLTGNFSYLNFLSSAFCVILISDYYWKAIAGLSLSISEASSLPVDILVSIVGIGLLFLQIVSLWNYFMPNRTFYKILDWFHPYHIVNRYGIFAIMTTKRHEIIVEGSDDGVKWEEYLFYHKPSELNRRPRRISPYQPRLDWQAWFLPFTNYHSELWFQNFLVRLLQGSPDVLKLLRHNPFPQKAPRHIRALVYDYEFTSAQEKKETGNWWRRVYIGIYSPTLSLKKEDK